MKLIEMIKSWFRPKQRYEGVIKFFDRKKRFGFIIGADNEYFFHAAAVRGGDYRFLQDGAHVTYTLAKGRKGPQADDVMVVTKSSHKKRTK